MLVHGTVSIVCSGGWPRRLLPPFILMQTLSFKSSVDFRCWLEKSHAGPDGLWLRFYKKSSGQKTITHAEALDEALCFGWIDGQAKPLDDRSWIQKFTPRRSRSGWSKKNTEHIERLTLAGAMTAAGLKAVEAAKADGRWKAAYDSPRDAKPPKDFLAALKKIKERRHFSSR